MRKIVFLHLSLLLCMVYACSPPFESKKESEKQSVISEARAYFETNASDLLPLTFPDRRLSTKTSSFSSTELTPLWDKAYETNHNGVQFVEVPLSSTTQLICVETVKRVAGADPEKRISCQRLLVIANTSLGKEMYVATLVPSEAYLAQTKNWTVEPRTEKGELLDFSGRVFYSTLKGDCRRGVTYENGVIGDRLTIGKVYGYGICIEQGVSDRYSTIRFVEENMPSITDLTRTNQAEKSQNVFLNTIERANIGAGGIAYTTTYSDNIENDPDYALGVEAAEKMLADIENDNYGLYEVEDRGNESENRYLAIDGSLFVVDMMDFKVSCMSFVSGLLESDRIAITKLGRFISGAGLLLNGIKTWIAFSDGDITSEDIGIAVMTALSAVGFFCAFLNIGFAIAGTIGTITSVIGVASDICSLTRSTLVRVSLKNGKNVYVYIS